MPRRFLGSALLGCGCAGCAGSSAQAEVALREEAPLQRGRQDEDFAKGDLEKWMILYDLVIFFIFYFNYFVD